MVVNADLPLWLAGIGIALAVPVTFMVANWVRKNVDHGEMRFDTRDASESDEETK
ncbi:MAG: glutamyl-tRNA amidotransferase [Sphingomonadales bacterium]|nr:glutamyl-tRNA amidotransferase [Sphingomonadales bacterium]NCQ21896.1 glutamyl-tRNA amidotransferase [Sphingomonadales bacterium]NCT03292.1 glutamyl-tRNA amidotransferase [Sphingomonadales bacterium]